jgi:O-methyltransferase
MRLIVSFVSWILKSASRGLSTAAGRPIQLQLCHQRTFTTDQPEAGKVWPGYAHTMIGLRRLDSLQSCLETALQECIKGDLIETGVWRGGACIFMRAVMAAYAVEDRKVYVADSFEGLPAPEPEKFPADRGDELYTHTYLAVSQDEVKTNFRRFGLLDDQVVFLKGWFKDTLPKAKIEKLAVLRLDGDMYSSTMDSLTNLYPKLSDGGFCIVDDYDLHGCRKAVDEFRAANGVHAEMKAVDSGCKFWRKE